MAKSDLALRPEAPLSLTDELLGMMGDAAGEGLENVSSNEIILPRLAIIQPTSPMVEEGTARPGDLANILTGENFGNKVTIFPLMFWSSRIDWDSKDLNSRILCSAKDGRNGTQKTEDFGFGVCSQCPRSQWTDGEGPTCTEFKNVLLVPVRLDAEDLADAIASTAPVVFSAKRTAITAVNKFLSAAMALRPGGKRVPLFSSVWTLSTEKKQNEKGTFFLPSFSRNGFVQSADIFKYLRGTYQEMKEAQERFAVDQSEAREGAAANRAPDFISDEDDGSPY